MLVVSMTTKCKFILAWNPLHSGATSSSDFAFEASPPPPPVASNSNSEYEDDDDDASDDDDGDASSTDEMST